MFKGCVNAGSSYGQARDARGMKSDRSKRFSGREWRCTGEVQLCMDGDKLHAERERLHKRERETEDALRGKERITERKT